SGPREHAEDLRHRGGREERAIRAGRKLPRLLAEERQLLAGEAHLPIELRALPRRSGVGRLHRLVAIVIEAPAEVEALDRVPMPHAERAREALPDRSRGMEAHEVEPTARREHLVDHLRGIRKLRGT